MIVCLRLYAACVFGRVCLQMVLAHLKYLWQEAVLWTWTKPNTPLRSLLPWDHHLGIMFRTFEDSSCVFLTFSLLFEADPEQLQSTKGINRNPLQTRAITVRHADHIQGLRQNVCCCGLIFGRTPNSWSQYKYQITMITMILWNFEYSLLLGHYFYVFTLCRIFMNNLDFFSLFWLQMSYFYFSIYVAHANCCSGTWLREESKLKHQMLAPKHVGGQLHPGPSHVGWGSLQTKPFFFFFNQNKQRLELQSIKVIGKSVVGRLLQWRRELLFSLW